MSRTFRGDIEGLRTVAVGTVLLYHAGLLMFPGGFVGVDVFFAISGFLITGLLIREVEETGRVSLITFYARRMKRLLPATAVVLVTTAILTLIFLPITRWWNSAVEIVASALYVVNWRFADQAVDYLAQDDGNSPVLHFWSLAVEEQFYVVWPLMILLVVFIARRRSVSMRNALLVGLLVIAIPSFAYSLHLTADRPELAFFVTPTRLWELALGSLLALLAPLVARFPAIVLWAGGWIGLALIGYATVSYSSATPWPGWRAMVPALGAVAVIAAGLRPGGWGPRLLLDTGPFRWIGGLSYSIYLWHWPLIVAADAYLDDMGPWEGLAVAVFSIVPAWITHRFVENPLRFLKAFSVSPKLAIAWGANFTLIGVVAGLVVVVALYHDSSSEPSTANAQGAAVLGDTPLKSEAAATRDSFEFFTPSVVEARNDNANQATKSCDQPEAGTEAAFCTFGDENGDTVIAMVGNSKTRQWIPMMAELGRERGWRILTFTKSACEFNSAPARDSGNDVTDDYPECDTWNDNVLDRLTGEIKPDVVVTALDTPKVSQESEDQDVDEVRRLRFDGVRETWSTLTGAGAEVIVLTASPRFDDNVPDCVADHEDHLSECALPRGEALASDRVWTVDEAKVATEGLARTTLVDLNDFLCPEECPVVIGNVLMYYDSHHLTATYVKTLGPQFLDRVTGVL